MVEMTQNEVMAAEAPAQDSHRSLGRKFFKNTVALAFGWNLNAVLRLVGAGIVVRSFGVNVFGEYALLVVWLTIAEWILDFGTTEVFVREANHEPGRRSYFSRVFLALKIVQAPVAVLVLAAGLIAMRYSRELVVAGIASGLSLFFTAGVVYCRANFKAALTMEREVFSEFISVVAMLPLILLVAHLRWGLIGVMGTYVFSRAVFCAGCYVQSRKLVLFSVSGISMRDLRWGVESSLTIGVIGFVVVVYNAADLLVLSRTATISDVAVYSAALRFTMPLTMALNAIAVSVYPVLSLLKSPEQFHKTCQRAVNTTLLLGCLALVGLWCGAEFCMSLLGHQLVYGANALRILAIVCVIKAVPMVIGPALFLVRAQKYALRYIVAALLVKVAVITVATLRFGYMGGAFGSLLVEACFLTPVTMYYVRVFTGFKIRFAGIWRLVPVVIIVVAVTRRVLPQGNILGGIMAVLLYPVLVLAFGVIDRGEIRALLRLRRPEQA
jgi:O-antigen/teichoic acid export membrane protein